jgi:RNA polymerase sigma factor (sigma-70 family)
VSAANVSPTRTAGGLDSLASRARDDAGARSELVEELLPMVRRMARRYAGRGVTLDDLINDGVLGLLRAVVGYDAGKGSFVPWARLWIRQSLQQAVAERSRPFRVPTSVLWDMHELKQARERLLATLGREPDHQQLADALGWGVGRVADVVRAERVDYDEGEMDLVACPLADAEYERVLERLALTQLRPLLLRLTERERDVLAARAEGESLRTIGRRLGLSGERVRKIEQQAIEKMAAASKTVDTRRLLVTSTG